MAVGAAGSSPSRERGNFTGARVAVRATVSECAGPANAQWVYRVTVLME